MLSGMGDTHPKECCRLVEEDTKLPVHLIITIKEYLFSVYLFFYKNAYGATILTFDNIKQQKFS